MNIPFVKGWIPFKGSLIDKTVNEQEDNINTADKVDVPKGWKDTPFKVEDNPHGRLFALSQFEVLYPKALDVYLKEIFPIVKKSLEEFNIKADLNRLDGQIVVKTTPKTFDPVAILKAHSLAKLLARYVPIDDALTVLNGELCEDIIEISHRKKDSFIRRKGRFDNNEIKELIREVLDCRVFISGKSVAAIGSYENLKRVRTIVSDCFERNTHPIYHLKRFQIMNKLREMPEMADKDWSDFLPAIPKSKTVKRKKPAKVRKKKEYTPFPPEQQQSKVDQELASGVFHLKYERKNKNYFEPVAKRQKKNSSKDLE